MLDSIRNNLYLVLKLSSVSLLNNHLHRFPHFLIPFLQLSTYYPQMFILQHSWSNPLYVHVFFHLIYLNFHQILSCCFHHQKLCMWFRDSTPLGNSLKRHNFVTLWKIESQLNKTHQPDFSVKLSPFFLQLFLHLTKNYMVCNSIINDGIVGVDISLSEYL